MHTALSAELSGYPGIWQGRRHQQPAADSTGYPSLDRRLPGGGWPTGCLTELLTARPGTGEFELLMPMLANISSRGGWVVLVDPPGIPYPPAMHGRGIDLGRLLLVRTGGEREAMWACEQALHGVRGGVVLAWPPSGGTYTGFTRLRRLQLAARAGCKAAFLLRPATAARNASPATLRLHLEAAGHELLVTVLKCRGARPREVIRIRRTQPWPNPAPPAQDAGGASTSTLQHATSEEEAFARDEPPVLPCRRVGMQACPPG